MLIVGVFLRLLCFPKDVNGMSTACVDQEELQQAEKNAESGSETEDSSSSSDSSSSDKSSFGLSSEKSLKPAAKRRSGAKAKAKATEKKRKSGQVSKAGAGGPNKKQKAEMDKFNNVYDSSEKYLNTLLELKPDSLWRSCIRAGEVDRRLGREAGILSSLEAAIDTLEDDQDESKTKGKEMVQKVKQEVEVVRGLKEFCRILREARPAALVEHIVGPQSDLCSDLVLINGAEKYITEFLKHKILWRHSTST